MTTEDYYFIITRDRLEGDGPESAVGIERGRRHAGRAYKFELVDDDGIVYYEGGGTGEFEEQAWRWGAWFAGTTLLRVNGEVVIG